MSEQNREGSDDLDPCVKLRIEKNRQKALAIRQSKLVSHPYAKSAAVELAKNTIKIGTTKYKDTGGGFLLEEEEEGNETSHKVLQNQPPIIENERPVCIKCEKLFSVSWLFDNFDYKCCDECKDPDEEHKLISKTDAMTTYLLKDCDLDKRNPPLKYISKKNPHNVRWGEMKLYLQIQVEQRALDVWGSEEKIEEEREKREEKKVAAKAKKYNKQLKELRMNMRSSLYDRTTAASHVHDFDEEIYNMEDDSYSKKCRTCPYVEVYEKM